MRLRVMSTISLIIALVCAIALSLTVAVTDPRQTRWTLIVLLLSTAVFTVSAVLILRDEGRRRG